MPTSEHPLTQAMLDVSSECFAAMADILTVLGDEEVWQACLTHERLITAETLAIQFGAAADLSALPEHLGVRSTVGEGRPIRVVVSKK